MSTVSRDFIYKGVSVILRVPALFIAEAWYRSDPKLMSSRLAGKGLEQSQDLIIQAAYYSAILFSLTLLLLPLKKLVNLYMYIVSGLLLLIAHYLSYLYVETEKAMESEDLTLSLLDDTDSIRRLGVNIAAQGVISATIAYLINLRKWTKLGLLMYAAPMLARAVSYPVADLHRVHNFSCVFTMLMVVFYVFNHIPLVLDVIKTGLNKTYVAVQVYGWIPFLLMLWFKVLLPVQFLVFWLTLFSLQLLQFFALQQHSLLSQGWQVVLLASVGECCVSPISLVGLCVTVSYAAFVVLATTKLFLQGREAFAQDHVMHRGWTEGFTLFLLAVQTGLTELRAAQRAFLMSIVLFIVLASLVQSMYEITEPLLLALGAAQSRSALRHLRALLLCALLFCLPLYMTLYICRFFDADFWLLVVVSCCVLTSVQVLGSLLVYGLFMYDGLRAEPLEALDDVIYYAKAATRVLEFAVALFVVLYGLRESVLGELSWVNSGILVIHGYFNVFSRLQAGWRSYLLRREAARRIHALPEATHAQLAQHNDVCAICYQTLRSARITPCAHYFHSVCLRKWLYVQDKCPMCHQALATPSGEEKEDYEQQQQEHTHEQQQQHTQEQQQQQHGHSQEQQQQEHTQEQQHSQEQEREQSDGMVETQHDLRDAMQQHENPMIPCALSPTPCQNTGACWSMNVDR